MSQCLISENLADKLTNAIWDRWKRDGIKSRYINWLELKRLSEHYIKNMQQQNRDYQEIDFYTTLDANLNYYENLSIIDETTGPTEQALTDKYYNALIQEVQPELDKDKELEKSVSKALRLEQKLEATKENMQITEAKLQAAEKALTELKLNQAKQLETNFLNITPPATPEVTLKQIVIEAKYQNMQPKPKNYYKKLCDSTKKNAKSAANVASLIAWLITH